MNKKMYKSETNTIKCQVDKTIFKENVTPIFMTSSFVFDDAEDMERTFKNKDNYIYSRFANPNYDELIRKMCLLEKTEDGIITSTGMSSVFSSMAAIVGKGDHILSCRSIFASTNNIFQNIFPKWAIEVSYLDVDDTDNWQDSIKPNTKLLYIETPTNPSLDVVDIEWASRFCKKNGLLLIVDNCFATPYIQKPAEYGVDIIIHSATKYIDGQGRSLGGIILGKSDILEHIRVFTDTIGTAISPFNAWLMSKSLDTLHIRMQRHSENALELAKFLEDHPKIEQVRYPFLEKDRAYTIAKKQMKTGGGLVSFYIKGSKEDAQKFMNNLKIPIIASNLGDTKTIVTHPSSSTHSNVSDYERQKMKIKDNMVRISLGLESIDDIIYDIEQSLNKL